MHVAVVTKVLNTFTTLLSSVGCQHHRSRFKLIIDNDVDRYRRYKTSTYKRPTLLDYNTFIGPRNFG